MASKGINNENLNVRDQRAAETRRAKKAAKAAALGKGSKKQAISSSFSITDVIEDRKNRPINRLNRELEKQGETLNFGAKAHILCRDSGTMEIVAEQEKQQNRLFLLLGCDFRGDFNFERRLGLEEIHREWPSLKNWAFTARHGAYLDHGKHFPSALGGETPTWMTIIRIA